MKISTTTKRKWIFSILLFFIGAPMMLIGFFTDHLPVAYAGCVFNFLSIVVFLCAEVFTLAFRSLKECCQEKQQERDQSITNTIRRIQNPTNINQSQSQAVENQSYQSENIFNFAESALPHLMLPSYEMLSALPPSYDDVIQMSEPDIWRSASESQEREGFPPPPCYEDI
eukprot:TCONS_00067602-protein